ncbi:MAG: S8 family peptidase [Bacteroidales bacterium]
MKKAIIVLSLIVMLNTYIVEVFASDKLSPHTRAWIYNKNREAKDSLNNKSDKLNSSYAKTRISATTGEEYIGVFMSVEDLSILSEIESLGGLVNFAKNDIVVARIPVDMLTALSELKGVKRVEVERLVQAKNDKARSKSGVDAAHNGTALSNPYKGDGVLVAICDTGIDFNHLTFMDENGDSRAKRAYLPADEEGTAPVLSDGTVLVGSAYDNPTDISSLTTGTYDESHGTHVAGTAAGSYMGNDYYGVAPESSLLFADISYLSDFNIICAMQYIMDEAEKLGLPVSVNYSMGIHDRAHDGSSLISRAIDELTGAGKILSAAAGNEGGDKLYINKEFTDDDTSLKTLIVGYSEKYSYPEGDLVAWNNSDNAIGIRIFVYSFSKGEIVYESEIFKSESSDSFIINTDEDPELDEYYDGYVILNTGVSSYNNKYEIVCAINMIPDNYNSDAAPDYCLGFELIGGDGDQIDMWVDNNVIYLSSEGISDFVDGTSDFSVSATSTGENVISVGSYNSKLSYTTLDGVTHNSTSVLEGDISPFSSYAPLVDGKYSNPHVVAPGSYVISSMNSYDSYSLKNEDVCAEAVSEYDGRTYNWIAYDGTSMATPVVTGTIALWLEADPTLTPARIKEIFDETSIRDSYVTEGDPRRWGAGKIDAYAGLVAVLESASVEGVIDSKKINNVLIYNQRSETFDLYVPSETETVRVNIYDISGSLLYSTVADGSNVINIDASGKLGSAGIKIVQVVGSQVNYSAKIVIK